MKKTLLAVSAALAATAMPTLVHAEDAPSTSFNVGVVTDYRYRGISQSRLKPALQGGVDYSHPSGFYLGAWGSTIKWIKDLGTIAGADTGSTNVEIDLYGGYKGEVTKGLGYDVGGLYYWYPSNKLGDFAGASNANTFELYGALSYSVFTAKYSHSLTSLFGTGGNGAANSKGSGYLDLSANFDLGNGFSLTPHVGRQEVRHYSAASYTDYSLTLGKDLGSGFSVSLAAVGTDADKTVVVSPAGKFLGRNALVLGAKFGF